MRLDLIGEEWEAQACRVVLQSGVVTVLRVLQASIAAVAVVVRLLAEVDLEAFLPALLPAGLAEAGGEHGQSASDGLGLIVALVWLAQIER